MTSFAAIKPVLPLFAAVGTAVTGGLYLGFHTLLSNNEVM